MTHDAGPLLLVVVVAEPVVVAELVAVATEWTLVTTRDSEECNRKVCKKKNSHKL